LQIARDGKISIASNATKPKIQEQIIIWSVGRRLNSEAVSRPGPSAISPKVPTTSEARKAVAAEAEKLTPATPAVAKKAAAKTLQAKTVSTAGVDLDQATDYRTASNALTGYPMAYLRRLAELRGVDIKGKRGKAGIIAALIADRGFKPTSKVAPEPKQLSPDPTVSVPGGPIRAGDFSQVPVPENTWGSFSESEIHYHDHGKIGRVVARLGADRDLNVDGDKLETVLGRIATDTVLGRTTPDEQIEALKQLRDRLPTPSRANTLLSNAIEDLDSPKRTIQIPERTPPFLANLARDLEQIPIARGGTGSRSDGDKEPELDMLQKILANFDAGQLSPLSLQRELQRLQNRRHESVEGKFAIDGAIRDALKEFDSIFSNPARRQELRRTPS
jgi:hypothetical protein